ncbi:hypothetical protein B6I76_30625 [Klebsiella pneumoniae]|uniref:hypothetical protein n=1 Tax=Klebsiella pneumoniae TaxID=573 RepID=UPI000C7ADBF3|nr:hypothetical protein [Klebsiella pneumoniae]PLE62409.1 hypothetical protein B6I76_30625 [Klebsiella pneumoniae]
MTMNRITDESLSQLAAIEWLASDNASDENRQADQIYHSNVAAALCELQERRKVETSPQQVTSDFFISGVRDEDGDCTAVEDAAAQFWTVYRRNEDGTCDALMDFVSRESAEKAIQMIAPNPAQTGVDDDVRNIIGLLEINEWAEHCTETVLGSRLEAEITRLVGHAQPAQIMNDIPEIITELEQVFDWIMNTLPVPTPLTIPNARRLTNVIIACRAAMLKGGAE